MLFRLPPYPRAYWVLIACFFLNRVGASLIWPFMTVYIRTQTGAPLSQIAGLLSIQAVASLIGTSAIGAVMDQFGRKRAMLAALVLMSGVLLVMSRATSVWQFAPLMALYGILHPVFFVGTNAMVADLVAPERRTAAYALTRTFSNLAIAVGPLLGGAFIVHSHLFAYLTTIAINLALVPLVLVFIGESLPQREQRPQERSGYGAILRDRPFIRFIAVFMLVELAIALVFNLLSVYTKEQYGILEDEYGRILAVNAVMVVLFQFAVTRVTQRFRPFVVMMVGSLFYVVGLVGFGLSSAVAHFVLGMIVMTIGELILSPTATALVAALSPAEMRGRYMSVYALTFTFGTGVGPVMGGLLSDAIAPAAIWWGGAGCALLAAVGFAWIDRTSRQAAGEAPALAAEGLPASTSAG